MDRVVLGNRLASVLVGLALFSGCGNPGGGGGGGGADPTLTVSITDAASDDVESFTVDVTSIDLHKLGGAVVSVVSTPTTVDLATLSDTSQILNAHTVPAGTYVSATITLDFTNSVCMLNGQTTPATILDDAGNPLTGPLVLPIQFGANRLICPFNRHKLLEFDFDLNQSLMSDTIGNTVTVEPAFAMHVDPAAPKPLVALGTLTSVDTGMSTFVGELTALDGTPIGPATFHVSTATIYQIDGVPSVGAAGLTDLAAMPAGTSFQALATIDPLQPELEVVVLEVGSGTWNGGDDIVEGHIVDRAGAAGTDPILTVLGHSSNAAHTVFQFNTTFTVTASFANTKVVRPASATIYDADDLNVGQRIRVFGTLTGVTMDATAARDVVRMQPTAVFGHATGAPAPPDLEIDLTRVDLRPQSAFTWASGGPTPPDPAHFSLLVNNLGSGLGIAATTPVAAVGFFSAFDDANEDFQATALANLENVPSLMLVHNRPAGLVVDATASAASIVLTISGTAVPGEFAIIDQSLIGVTQLPTSPSPTIQPPALAGPRWYSIRDKVTGSTTIYIVFADFSAALDNLLTGGATIDHITAVGIYTSASNTIAAPLATVVVE
jgi:hypothetical protein